jgi:predicted nucleic acid-binding Zn ribbon protein
MTAQRDLPAIAAATEVPTLPDGTRARAYLIRETRGPDHAPTKPCRHVDRWRVVFGLDYGRRDSAPVGPAFDRPADAAALARHLNRDAAPPDASAAAIATAHDDVREGVTGGRLGRDATAAPVTASPVPAAAQEGTCVVCQRPLPPSAQRRRTCSDRCRMALSRRYRRVDGGQLTLELETSA